MKLTGQIKSFGVLYLILVSWAPAGYCLTTFRSSWGFEWGRLSAPEVIITIACLGLALLGQFTAVCLARDADSAEDLRRQLAERAALRPFA